MDEKPLADSIHDELHRLLVEQRAVTNTVDRDVIVELIARYLRSKVPHRKSTIEIFQQPTSPGKLLFKVVTRDPEMIAAYANAGLLEEPAQWGLERVVGSHGAVWVWPEMELFHAKL